MFKSLPGILENDKESSLSVTLKESNIAFYKNGEIVEIDSCVEKEISETVIITNNFDAPPTLETEGLEINVSSEKVGFEGWKIFGNIDVNKSWVAPISNNDSVWIQISFNEDKILTSIRLHLSDTLVPANCDIYASTVDSEDILVSDSSIILKDFVLCTQEYMPSISEIYLTNIRAKHIRIYFKPLLQDQLDVQIIKMDLFQLHVTEKILPWNTSSLIKNNGSLLSYKHITKQLLTYDNTTRYLYTDLSLTFYNVKEFRDDLHFMNTDNTTVVFIEFKTNECVIDIEFELPVVVTELFILKETVNTCSTSIWYSQTGFDDLLIFSNIHDDLSLLNNNHVYFENTTHTVLQLRIKITGISKLYDFDIIGYNGEKISKLAVKKKNEKLTIGSNYGGFITNCKIHHEYLSPNQITQLHDNITQTNSLYKVVENEWVDLAATYDKITKTIKFYKNGSLLGAIKDYENEYIIDILSDVYIGKCNDDYFNGKVSNIRLYNRLLESSEVSALSNDYDRHVNSHIGYRQILKLNFDITRYNKYTVIDSSTFMNDGICYGEPTTRQISKTHSLTTINYNVTADNHAYVFENIGNNPDLNVTLSDTLIFDINTLSGTSSSFRIMSEITKSSVTEGIINNGISSGILTWTPTESGVYRYTNSVGSENSKSFKKTSLSTSYLLNSTDMSTVGTPLNINDMTLVFWSKKYDNGRHIYLYNTTNSNKNIHWYAGQSTFQFRLQSDVAVINISQNVASDDEWHMWVLTIYVDDSTMYAKGYIDTSDNVYGPTRLTYIENSGWNITHIRLGGNRYSLSNQSHLDDVSMFRGQLSANDVDKLYNDKISPKDLTSDNNATLYAYWNFEGNYHDNGPNGNQFPLTLHGHSSEVEFSTDTPFTKYMESSSLHSNNDTGKIYVHNKNRLLSNYALHLDPTKSQYIELPNTYKNLKMTNFLTCMWLHVVHQHIYDSQTPKTNPLLYFKQYDNNHIQLCIYQNTLRCIVNDVSHTYESYQLTLSETDNKWIHISIYVNYSNSTINLYVNGLKITTFYDVSFADSHQIDQIFIGKNKSEDYLHGDIDNIQMYQGHMDDNDVQNIYISSIQDDQYIPPSIQENTWTHVAASFDKSNKEIRLYHNGDHIASHLDYNPVNIGDNISTNILLGKDADHLYYGKMNDVRVYQRVLPNTELREIYERTLSNVDKTIVDNSLNNSYHETYVDSSTGMCYFKDIHNLSCRLINDMSVVLWIKFTESNSKLFLAENDILLEIINSSIYVNNTLSTLTDIVLNHWYVIALTYVGDQICVYVIPFVSKKIENVDFYKSTTSFTDIDENMKVVDEIFVNHVFIAGFEVFTNLLSDEGIIDVYNQKTPLIIPVLFHNVAFEKQIVTLHGSEFTSFNAFILTNNIEVETLSISHDTEVSYLVIDLESSYTVEQVAIHTIQSLDNQITIELLDDTNNIMYSNIVNLDSDAYDINLINPPVLFVRYVKITNNQINVPITFTEIEIFGYHSAQLLLTSNSDNILSSTMSEFINPGVISITSSSSYNNISYKIGQVVDGFKKQSLSNNFWLSDIVDKPSFVDIDLHAVKYVNHINIWNIRTSVENNQQLVDNFVFQKIAIYGSSRDTHDFPIHFEESSQLIYSDYDVGYPRNHNIDSIPPDVIAKVNMNLRYIRIMVQHDNNRVGLQDIEIYGNSVIKENVKQEALINTRTLEDWVSILLPAITPTKISIQQDELLTNNSSEHNDSDNKAGNYVDIDVTTLDYIDPSYTTLNIDDPRIPYPPETYTTSGYQTIIRTYTLTGFTVTPYYRQRNEDSNYYTNNLGNIFDGMKDDVGETGANRTSFLPDYSSLDIEFDQNVQITKLVIWSNGMRFGNRPKNVSIWSSDTDYHHDNMVFLNKSVDLQYKNNLNQVVTITINNNNPCFTEILFDTTTTIATKILRIIFENIDNTTILLYDLEVYGSKVTEITQSASISPLSIDYYSQFLDNANNSYILNTSHEVLRSPTNTCIQFELPTSRSYSISYDYKNAHNTQWWSNINNTVRFDSQDTINPFPIKIMDFETTLFPLPFEIDADSFFHYVISFYYNPSDTYGLLKGYINGHLVAYSKYTLQQSIDSTILKIQMYNDQNSGYLTNLRIYDDVLIPYNVVNLKNTSSYNEDQISLDKCLLYYIEPCILSDIDISFQDKAKPIATFYPSIDTINVSEPVGVMFTDECVIGVGGGNGIDIVLSNNYHTNLTNMIIYMDVIISNDIGISSILGASYNGSDVISIQQSGNNFIFFDEYISFDVSKTNTWITIKLVHLKTRIELYVDNVEIAVKSSVDFSLPNRIVLLGDVASSSSNNAPDNVSFKNLHISSFDNFLISNKHQYIYDISNRIITTTFTSTLSTDLAHKNIFDISNVSNSTDNVGWTSESNIMLPYNIVVSFPNAIRLDSMFIMESISRNNVTSFTIQASNDNINWTSMFTGSTIGESGIEFEVSSISFIYWKLSIVDVENQGNKCVDIKYWNILHEASKIYNAMSSFDEIIPQHSLHLNLLDVFSYIKADFTLIDDNRFKPEYLSINGWVLLNNSAVDILCMTESTTETNIRTSVYWTKLNHINLSFNKNTNTCMLTIHTSMADTYVHFEHLQLIPTDWNMFTLTFNKNNDDSITFKLYINSIFIQSHILHNINLDFEIGHCYIPSPRNENNGCKIQLHNLSFYKTILTNHEISKLHNHISIDRSIFAHWKFDINLKDMINNIEFKSSSGNAVCTFDSPNSHNTTFNTFVDNNFNGTLITTKDNLPTPGNVSQISLINSDITKDILVDLSYFHNNESTNDTSILELSSNNNILLYYCTNQIDGFQHQLIDRMNDATIDISSYVTYDNTKPFRITLWYKNDSQTIHIYFNGSFIHYITVDTSLLVNSEITIKYGTTSSRQIYDNSQIDTGMHSITYFYYEYNDATLMSDAYILNPPWVYTVKVSKPTGSECVMNNFYITDAYNSKLPVIQKYVYPDMLSWTDQAQKQIMHFTVAGIPHKPIIEMNNDNKPYVDVNVYNNNIGTQRSLSELVEYDDVSLLLTCDIILVQNVNTIKVTISNHANSIIWGAIAIPSSSIIENDISKQVIQDSLSSVHSMSTREKLIDTILLTYDHLTGNALSYDENYTVYVYASNFTHSDNTIYKSDSVYLEAPPLYFDISIKNEYGIKVEIDNLPQPVTWYALCTTSSTFMNYSEHSFSNMMPSSDSLHSNDSSWVILYKDYETNMPLVENTYYWIYVYAVDATGNTIIQKSTIDVKFILSPLSYDFAFIYDGDNSAIKVTLSNITYPIEWGAIAINFEFNSNEFADKDIISNSLYAVKSTGDYKHDSIGLLIYNHFKRWPLQVNDYYYIHLYVTDIYNRTVIETSYYDVYFTPSYVYKFKLKEKEDESSNFHYIEFEAFNEYNEKISFPYYHLIISANGYNYGSGLTNNQFSDIKEPALTIENIIRTDVLVLILTEKAFSFKETFDKNGGWWKYDVYENDVLINYLWNHVYGINEIASQNTLMQSLNKTTHSSLFNEINVDTFTLYNNDKFHVILDDVTPNGIVGNYYNNKYHINDDNDNHVRNIFNILYNTSDDHFGKFISNIEENGMYVEKFMYQHIQVSILQKIYITMQYFINSSIDIYIFDIQNNIFNLITGYETHRTIDNDIEIIEIIFTDTPMIYFNTPIKIHFNRSTEYGNEFKLYHISLTSIQEISTYLTNNTDNYITDYGTYETNNEPFNLFNDENSWLVNGSSTNWFIYNFKKPYIITYILLLNDIQNYKIDTLKIWVSNDANVPENDDTFVIQFNELSSHDNNFIIQNIPIENTKRGQYTRISVENNNTQIGFSRLHIIGIENSLFSYTIDLTVHPTNAAIEVSLIDLPRPVTWGAIIVNNWVSTSQYLTKDVISNSVYGVNTSTYQDFMDTSVSITHIHDSGVVLDNGNTYWALDSKLSRWDQ